MKTNLLLITLTFTLMGCKPKVGEFQKIEMMAYHWSRYNDTTQKMVPPFLKCRKYIRIDRYGTGSVYLYKNYPTPTSTFVCVEINKDIISNILNSSLKIDSTQLSVFDGKPLIYDGPILKVRIDYSDTRQMLFSFIELNYHNEVNNLIESFHIIDSIILKTNIEPIDNLTEFEKDKNQFIRACISYDTLNLPKAPPPSQEE
jgi:hypothetical protein